MVKETDIYYREGGETDRERVTEKEKEGEEMMREKR